MENSDIDLPYGADRHFVDDAAFDSPEIIRTGKKSTVVEGFSLEEVVEIEPTINGSEITDLNGQTVSDDDLTEAEGDEIAGLSTLNTSAVIAPVAVDPDASLSNEPNEKISEAVLESFNDSLETEDGIEELGEKLDGIKEGERSAGEEETISETTDQITEVIENTSVTVTDDDGTAEIETANGDTIQVELDENQDSTILETEDGETIIILSSDLDAEEVVDETIDALSEVIEDVAVENGITPIEGHIQALLKEISAVRVRVVWELFFPRHEHIQLLNEIDQDQHGKADNENT